MESGQREGMRGQQELCGQVPEIEYPCEWEYRVIGLEEERLRAVVESVLRDHPYSIRVANRSRSGKYLSIVIETVVHSESARVSWFQELRSHQDVKMVL
jgi:putative lipoic acid-binding regulatory protein